MMLEAWLQDSNVASDASDHLPDGDRLPLCIHLRGFDRVPQGSGAAHVFLHFNLFGLGACIVIPLKAGVDQAAQKAAEASRRLPLGQVTFAGVHVRGCWSVAECAEDLRVRRFHW